MWVFYAVCFAFLALTLKKIDVGVAYAIWSGVGTALIATVGIIYFREPLTMMRAIGLITIIAGVVILNLTGGSH
jgi:small multidrug resistance pump